jgi:hypothetical protein
MDRLTVVRDRHVEHDRWETLLALEKRLWAAGHLSQWMCTASVLPMAPLSPNAM